MNEHEQKMIWARATFAALYDALERLIPDCESVTDDRKIAMRRLLDQLQGEVTAYLMEQKNGAEKVNEHQITNEHQIANDCPCCATWAPAMADITLALVDVLTAVGAMGESNEEVTYTIREMLAIASRIASRFVESRQEKWQK